MIGKISPSLFIGCKLSLAALDFIMEMLLRLLRNLRRIVNCVIPNDVCVVLADGCVCWEARGRQGDSWRWDKCPEVAALIFFVFLVAFP